MSNLLPTPRPLRVAIVGSGPSGFYAAEALLASGRKVRVELFDRLPAPFGLVRYGVAPDHAKIKGVIRVFEKIAQRPEFAFLGNVRIGHDLKVAELRSLYDAVLFACGAETDKRLGIPGEDLPGSYTATEFVAWYNGHPDYRDRTFDLSHEEAFVIGVGNVAMDVSRVLSKTVDELRRTDIASHALEALAVSRVREVHLVGRRGPVQAAFTPAEIKEFGDLADCDPVMDPADLALNPESLRELDDPLNGNARRNVETLREFASRPPPRKARRFVLHFLESPVALLGERRVERIVLEKNALSGDAGNQKARGTGAKKDFPCGLIFRSVGYRGVPIPGVPFDEKTGVFPNREGRILENGSPVPGLYAAGWIKRGPSGVIGTNKPDAAATVAALLADFPSDPKGPAAADGAARDLLARRGIRAVTYEDWKRIDSAEVARGAPAGKPREKFPSVEEMLAVLR